MNDRIKELAEQSGMTQYVAAHNRYLERFAELIVRECIDAHEDHYGVDIIGDVLKKHFGVEE